MMQSTLVECDHCTDETKFSDEENPFEAGWISVWEYDSMSEEIQSLDFCSRDCLTSHFS